MAHRSGNPTWQDYPAISTPITAVTLEGIENAIDGPRPGMRARAIASQTVASSATWTAVLLGAEDYDDFGGHTTTGNSGRFTAQADGRYRVSASVLWTDAQATSAPRRAARLAKNGTQVPGSQILGSYPGIFYSLVIPPTLVTLTVGDYVELQVLTGAAGASMYATADDGAVLTVELA